MNRIFLSKRLRFLMLPTLMIWVMALAMLGETPASSAQTAVTQTGWLTLIYGDAPAGSGLPARLEIALLDDAGARLARLAMDDFVARRYYGQQVRVTGAYLISPSVAGAEAALAVTEIVPLAADAPAGAPNPKGGGRIAGAQPWVNILCKFSDVSSTPHPPSYFNQMFSTSYKGLDHYWRRMSFDQISLAGSATTSKWITLPKPRAYYMGPERANLGLLAADCTQAADAEVFFPNFVGINLIFNDDLDCCAWGGGQSMTLDGQTRFYRITWLPPWGQRHDIIAHEMGHGFGMPHSTGPANNPPVDFGVYVSNWDVMSAAGGVCRVWNDGRDYCLSQGTIAYHRDLAGWLPGARIAVAATHTETTFTLDRLIQPQTPTNPLMIRVPINNSTTRFYTVEVRDLVEYDQNIPTQAVLIHDVDTTRFGNAGHAYIVDSDQENNDPNDAGAVWTVGESFYDAANNIRIDIVSAENGSPKIYINNNASFIQGVVTNASGAAPVASALVDAVDADSGRWLGFVRARADGSYRIAVPPGRIVIYAEAAPHALEYYDGAEGVPYYAQALPITIGQSETINGITLRLDAGGTVVGSIRDQAGNPLAGMRVGFEETLLFACSDADGTFTLAGLPLNTPFTLYSGGDNACDGGPQGYIRQWWPNAEAPSAATPITVTSATEPLTGLTFALAQGGTLSGVVERREDNGGIAEAWVCAYDVDSPDFDQIAPDLCVQTDTRGFYRLDDVAAGIKRLRAFAPGRARLFYDNATTYDNAELVLVVGGSEHVRLDFSLPLTGRVAGVVYSQDGETPLAGVTLSNEADAFLGCSGEDGRYTLDLPPGTHRIKAGTGPCGAVEFPVQYYANSPTLAGARPVTVVAGSTLTSIDFVRAGPVSRELIANGGFEVGRANGDRAAVWTAQKLVNDRRVCDDQAVKAGRPNAARFGQCAFQFRADKGTTSSITQVIQASQAEAGDTLVFGAWVEGRNLSGASVVATIYYVGGGTHVLRLPPGQLNSGDYGYTAHNVQRVLRAKVRRIEVVVRQTSGTGRLRIDDVSLVIVPASLRATGKPVELPPAPDLRGH